MVEEGCWTEEVSSVVVVDVPRSLEQPLADKIRTVKLDKRKVFISNRIAPASKQVRLDDIEITEWALLSWWSCS